MKANEAGQPISLTLRIDWSEMDEFSHVNNVMFFKYIQSARVNYWQETGIYEQFKRDNIGPMVLSVNCRFIKPLYFPGRVHIHTHTEHIGNTSFSFVHQLYNEQQMLVAEATDVMVMYDFNREQKISFPAELRRIISQREGKPFDQER